MSRRRARRWKVANPKIGPAKRVGPASQAWFEQAAPKSIPANSNKWPDGVYVDQITTRVRRTDKPCWNCGNYMEICICDTL